MTPRSIGIVALLVAVYVYGWDQRRRGRIQERGRVVAARIDTLTREVVRLDTVWRMQRAVTTRTLTLYDTARVTDTVVVERNDTVRVFVPRDAADAAVTQCRALIFACDRRVAASDSLVAGLRLQIRTLESDRPSAIETWGWRAFWFGVGRYSK